MRSSGLKMSLVTLLALAIAVLSVRARFRPAPEPARLIVGDDGRALQSVFEGIPVSGVVRAPGPVRAKRGGACAAGTAGGAPLLSRLLRLLGPTSASASGTGCVSESPHCYGHYTVWTHPDCVPGCNGQYDDYYYDSSKDPAYDNGEFMDGTANCVPVCSVCNYASCINGNP